MPLLSVHNLSLTLGNQKILNDISFEVEQGEIIGLIGPNGSGKTTLFNVLSGFLQPNNGSITFQGKNITQLSPAKRAQRGIGRVFQNFGIFREMTLEENVLVALEALPKEKRQDLGDVQKKVQETLALVGLQDKAKEKASCLSGGQMRLLEIGRTLASAKELFLLDEPTAGVSPKMTNDVSSLITELKREGKTVLIIEHDLPFIAKICDRVLVLDVGSLVISGTPQEVHHDKKLQEIYFGADPTD
jgi:branched-chain amino acid transport system ATP-binding protein